MLTYVNKKAERSNYPLATALESTNTEMTKRLKYTKEILAHMVKFSNLTTKKVIRNFLNEINCLNLFNKHS